MHRWIVGYHALHDSHATRFGDAIYPSLYPILYPLSLYPSLYPPPLSCARCDDSGPQDFEVALTADDLG
jgi:hypothetical protein